MGYPGYALLTIDERRILDLIAAAQSDDVRGFEAYLHGVAHATLGPALGIAARVLATALNEHDLRLSIPRRDSLSALAAMVQPRHDFPDGSLRGSKGNAVRFFV